MLSLFTQMATTSRSSISSTPTKRVRVSEYWVVALIEGLDENSQWCWENFLNFRSLQSADNVRNQLKRTMEKYDLELVSTAFGDPKYLCALPACRQEADFENSDNIRKALVCGYFMHAAHKEDKGQYLTVKDHQPVGLHPSCGLDSNPLVSA
jgi:pre-mRNA-splicing factor ATP-dependent RNA helicase DHX15/PRP43